MKKILIIIFKGTQLWCNRLMDTDVIPKQGEYINIKAFPMSESIRGENDDDYQEIKQIVHDYRVGISEHVIEVHLAPPWAV